MRAPLFAAAMADATPTSEVHLTRSTGNIGAATTGWATPPTGLVFVGDSICAFNPFYAQGISSASARRCCCATHLSLDRPRSTAFFQRFLAAQRKPLSVPWRLAMARDQGYECAVGTENRPSGAAASSPPCPVRPSASSSAPPARTTVVDEHFAKVFNLDESLGDMMRNPRVLAGLARVTASRRAGPRRVPFGFDPQPDPPATD